MDEALRDLVRHRAHHRCEYCRLRQEAAPVFRFHVEHIRARQHGGGDDTENLALACPNWNHHKGPNLSAVDPARGDVVMLFNPRTQEWSKHFEIVGVQILGQSATGRATASLLSMNSHQQQRVRKALSERGEWP